MKVSSQHHREVVRSDRRWLLGWLAVFLAWVGLMFAGVFVYRATGPHPEIRTFMRRVKHEVRWLIPFLKRKPNQRPIGIDGALHHGRSRLSGHAAQRAYARSGLRGGSSPISKST